MSQRRDNLARQRINQRLSESGERERLQEWLRMRLTECGWKESLKDHAKDIVRERGLDNVTVDTLIGELTPQARSSVPDDVKRELLTSIKNFLTEEMP